MPVTTALYNAHPDKISSLLADIEQQFTLDGDALISITSHFHKLFNLGLSEYGHPMAMMYVSTLRILVLSVHVKFQSHIRHWRSRWYGNWVTFQPRHASLAVYITPDSTALSSHLILGVQICEQIFALLLLVHSFSPVQAGMPSGVERRQNFHIETTKISRLRGSQDRGSDKLIRCVDFPLNGSFLVSHLDTTHYFLDLWGRLRTIYVGTYPAFRLAQTTLPTPWTLSLLQPRYYKTTCKTRAMSKSIRLRCPLA